MEKRYHRDMTRRTLLSASAALAATPLAAANRLPIKKGVLVTMLPGKLSYEERFQIAKDAGFEGIEGKTTEDPAEVDAIREDGHEDSLGDEHGALELSAVVAGPGGGGGEHEGHGDEPAERGGVGRRYGAARAGGGE
jgi:hypothetical protein